MPIKVQQLQYLMLPAQVGKGGVQALAAADALQRLCLFNCQIGKDVAMQLVTSFQSNAFLSLQELDLSGNIIQTPEMEALLIPLQGQGCGQALKVCAHLLTLRSFITDLALSVKAGVTLVVTFMQLNKVVVLVVRAVNVAGLLVHAQAYLRLKTL